MDKKTQSEIAATLLWELPPATVTAFLMRLLGNLSEFERVGALPPKLIEWIAADIPKLEGELHDRKERDALAKEYEALLKKMR